LGIVGLVVVIDQYEPVLRRLGLVTLDQVRAFQGSLVKNHRGRRDILRIDTTTEKGDPLVLFLKRILKPYRKDGLASLLSSGRVRSQSRQEWDNSRILLKYDIPVARPVAYGESCGLLWEHFSYLITEAATGSVTLDTFLRSCPDTATRQVVLSEMARLVRRLHDAGLASPDLLGRHVFLNLQTATHGFCLIDMARLDQFQRTPLRLRARDLASLHVSIPKASASTEERDTFLTQYCGEDFSTTRILPLIRHRTRHLLSQRRHRIPFFNLDLQGQPRT